MSDITNNSIFVAISFHSKYNNILNTVIIPAIEESGFKPAMADEKYGKTADIYKDIGKQIYSSNIIIADISRKYDDNGSLINLANVFYEIGLAHAIEKHVIILCRKGKEKEDMPYDLDRIRHLSYDPDNLFELRNELKNKIYKLKDEPDICFFDDLEIMTNSDKEELKRLRKRSVEITFKTFPPIADIFFNDKLLGESPQTIFINPDSPRNTLSIAAPSFYEYHKALKKEVFFNALKFNKGIINIELDPLILNQFDTKRVPGWLRDRRVDADNPVLMRAIAQYLNRISKEEETKEEAKKEIEELLKIAPGWYLAHNQLGVINKDDFDLSLANYKMATALNPNSYLGYYNQACAYARVSDFEKVIEYIEKIKEQKVLKSYSYTAMRLNDDSAFDKIKQDPKFKLKFEELIKWINIEADSFRQNKGNVVIS